ncbi:MAG: M14 family metallopeptidase [Pseudomonadota bacterium]|nr:M14 family metallopeptidase [Pseudomonadota bacterium]
MPPSQHFASDYANARAMFLDAAQAAGARLEHHRNPAATAPDGSELWTDIAVLGDPGAPNALLTISGTHGAEGFAGSGVQVGWLQSGLWQEVAPDTAQVLVHANNPYGFAALSRTNEDNVDLNRNFVDFSHPPHNARWDDVRAFVCPAEWDEATKATLHREMQAYVAKHGFWAFREAVTSGQYADPTGIFYGGAGPTWSRGIIEAMLATHCAGRRNLAVIDYHTGLGPRGFGERIVDHQPDSVAYARAVGWYDGDCASPHLGTSASAKLNGEMLVAIERALPDVAVTAIALEYGTQAEEQVIDALCADNWLRHHGDVNSARGREIKQAVRDAFYQDADDWKTAVFDRAVETQRLALKGMAG